MHPLSRRRMLFLEVIIAKVAQLVEHDLAPDIGYASTLASIFEKVFSKIIQHIIAKVAQLVEHDLAKVGVAGSNPVFRS